MRGGNPLVYCRVAIRRVLRWGRFLVLSVRSVTREALSPDFLHHQTCKACGRRDKMDFHVPDDVWEAVVPKRLRNRVVCLACFDEFARERGVEYATHMSAEMYFAGEGTSLLLRVAPIEPYTPSAPFFKINSMQKAIAQAKETLAKLSRRIK